LPAAIFIYERHPSRHILHLIARPILETRGLIFPRTT
jgi:hypothetical protein